ncbi:CHC2 zinc finger domain-containing protein [Neobacillus cucumis]|uniref:CHC2 zinc finger domain-containing protein n=1 Tax=Neobacillus cucumis TaxID=1740721 RepID=UPI00203C9FB8|nr:CHC2 zinc finger domain-containing protein [Neobacillus cucumis]MCM3724251.1 CHC2 zinc finger domain-containing protein [Neobacillus cucumis]
MNLTLDYTITEIKSKIDILTIVEESSLQLRKRGRNFIGLCPFHGEKTPSFCVNPQKNIFKCFGCGISGDQINLYAQLNSIKNGQAISQLAQRLGLSGKKLTKKQIIEVSKRQEDRNLEKRFEQEYKCLFYYLCNLRDYMKVKSTNHKDIHQLVQDPILIRYYHQSAYHEYLLEGLITGLLAELDFNQRIDFFESAIGVVNNWKTLLQKQKQSGFEYVELISY